MKTTYYYLFMFLLIGFVSQAQPYTLDKNINRYRLELKEDKKVKGATSVAANVTITNGMNTHKYIYSIASEAIPKKTKKIDGL